MANSLVHHTEIQMIENFFSGDLKIQIMKYCKKLEVISNEYDVLIFMARKSICFYDALLLNNMVKKTNPELIITTSSRILSYDCEFLRGKRIALLDDIVLKGNTLSETIKFLLEKNIDDFDVYYIASQNFESEKLKQIKTYLKEPILELENSEILVLGNAITNYISASACSYNVDYPVFYLNSGNDFFENYILKNNCALIPSFNFETNSSMYVQNFNCNKFFQQYDFSVLKDLKNRDTEVILKLRIFYRPDAVIRNVIVIPIIVLPELCEKDVRDIFNFVASTELYAMVKNNDEDKEIINMINVIQYILSFQLFKSVFQDQRQFDFIYSVDNQNYIFPQSYNKEIKFCLNKCINIEKIYLENMTIIDDFFALSEVYRCFFNFIGERHKNDKDHKTKFSFNEIYEYCSPILNLSNSEIIGFISILFDYAIDTGLIVPELSVCNNMFIRSYRLSEQYELQEKEFDLIIFMYNEYQNKTNKKNMNSILVEKLLVLFFKEVIMKLLKAYNDNQNVGGKPQNLFGITYARFGPVVSDNSLEVGVSKDSYLTKRLFDDSRSPYKRFYVNKKPNTYSTNEKKNIKIYVKQTTDNTFEYLPKEWKRNTILFVNQYNYFENLLNYYNVFNKVSFIKSFDQFLIIAAIGNNKDNQLLSLAAELKLYQINVASKRTHDDIIAALDSIMDGIINGVWKYICYHNNEYRNCYMVLANNIELEKAKLQEYDNEILAYRNYIDKLKNIIDYPSDNLVEEYKSILEIYKCCNNMGSKNINYINLKNKFNKLYTDNALNRQHLNYFAIKLKEKLYVSLDVLNREKDLINQSFIDTDKLESLFSEQNVGENKNEDLQNIVERLMDESVIILYEILIRWNYIITCKKLKIKNKDKNSNYLKNIKKMFENKKHFKDRLEFIENTELDYEKTISRFQEIEYEIDLLMYCINQYILKNSSFFIPINSFYILKRDDGNEIELDEVLSYKSKEIPLNKYFGFENSKSQAAFIKTVQSTKMVEKIKEFSGYTLLDYGCHRGCNTIIKIGENCYSKRVKGIIDGVIKTYFNKRIEITDERV